MGFFSLFTKSKQQQKIVPSQTEVTQAQMLMNQLIESVELVNTTTSPSTFLGRLNFSLDLLLELKKYEKYSIFTNSNPTNDYNKILNNLEATVNDFIDRVIIAQSEKNDALESQHEKNKKMEKCVERLWNSFYEANDYWRGNGAYPHYTGRLFTDSNLGRVEDIMQDLQQKVIQEELRKKSSLREKQEQANEVGHKGKMTDRDKKLYLVQHTYTEDMREVPNLPFKINCEVKRFIKENCHPFAYMDVIAENIVFVKDELCRVNTLIRRDCSKNSCIPCDLEIPIDEIVFDEKIDVNDRSKIICAPKTLSGKIAKYPYSVKFNTDMKRFYKESHSTHGELAYNQKGEIYSANIYFWRQHRGFFFYYKSIDGVLSLIKIETH